MPNLDTKHSEQTGVNVLVLAADVQQVERDDLSYPVCLTLSGGKSILELIVENTSTISGRELYFSFLAKQRIRFHLDDIVKQLDSNAKWLEAPEQTGGSACTALLAACAFNQESELLILSANEILDLDLNQIISDFRGRNLDAGTVTFHSLDPRYSFVAVNGEGLVTEAAQRRPISSSATAGLFWYRKTSEFVNAAMDSIRKDNTLDGKFYLAPVFNELILARKNVGVSSIPPNSYHPLKTIQQIQQFEGRN